MTARSQASYEEEIEDLKKQISKLKAKNCELREAKRQHDKDQKHAPFKWCATHGKRANVVSKGACCTYAKCDCRPGCDMRRLIIEDKKVAK